MLAVQADKLGRPYPLTVSVYPGVSPTDDPCGELKLGLADREPEGRA